MDKEKNEDEKFSIDFVVCWVNGEDEKWWRKMEEYKGVCCGDSNEVRFRDWGLLKYWFRAVEKYAPWVHRVYLVTDGQCPSFLNESYEKVRVVDHKDFMPASYLPSFNSNAIELNFHRIKGLSECFVAFNDDMYLNAAIGRDYYFNEEGLAVDSPHERVFRGREYDEEEGWGISVNDYCNVQVLNSHFDRWKVIMKNKKGWFGGYMGWREWGSELLLNLFGRKEFQHFHMPHNEKPLLKSVYEEAWEEEYKLLNESCTRFRENMNLTIYFIRYWQLVTNRFRYRNDVGKKKVVTLDVGCEKKVQELLEDEKVCSLCLNDYDGLTDEEFEVLRKHLTEMMQRKFPHKSKFEL